MESDTKIYLILCEDYVDVKETITTVGQRKATFVSHGVGNNTLKNYILPCDEFKDFKIQTKVYEDVEGPYILGSDMPPF